jgi:hypothetical protein
MSTNTGGPAFPQPNNPARGMTLRDWFAGQAMPELIGFGSPENGAKVAYEWADAMLKAREQ